MILLAEIVNITEEHIRVQIVPKGDYSYTFANDSTQE